MKLKYLITLISLLITPNALASSHSSLGLASSYFKENQTEYKTDYELNPVIVVNHLVDINKKVTVGYSTNLLDNLLVDRRDYDIKLSNGTNGINQQKITYHSILFGKAFGRWLPMLTLTDARVDNKFTISGHVNRRINHAVLYGANLTYFINKAYSASLAYTLPNKELGFDYGLSIIIGVKL